MSHRSLFRASTIVAGILIVFATASPALAGPPLLCHPFQTGTATMLPWGNGSGWNTPARGYKVENLKADLLKLLSADAPVLARMENLRRATIYATSDARVAADLLAALQARADAPNASALAVFDHGYLIESYKQAAAIARYDGLNVQEPSPMLKPLPDGYKLVVRAIALAHGSGDMEFAASLMSQGTVSAGHLQRARAQAKPDSLLALNLMR